MIRLKCPKCQSEVEIEDREIKDSGMTGVFCANEECFFHKSPLIGLDRKGLDGQEPGVYLSEAII